MGNIKAIPEKWTVFAFQRIANEEKPQKFSQSIVSGESFKGSLLYIIAENK